MNWLKSLDPRALLGADKNKKQPSSTSGLSPEDNSNAQTTTDSTNDASGSTKQVRPTKSQSTKGSASPSPASYLLSRYETAVKGLQDNATKNRHAGKANHMNAQAAASHGQAIYTDWQQLENELRLLPSVAVAIEEISSKLEYALAMYEELDARVDQLHIQKHERNLSAWEQRELNHMEQATIKDQTSILQLREQLARKRAAQDKQLAQERAKAEKEAAKSRERQQKFENDSAKAAEQAREKEQKDEFNEQFRRELAHVQERVGTRDLPDMSVEVDPAEEASLEAFLNASPVPESSQQESSDADNTEKAQSPDADDGDNDADPSDAIPASPQSAQVSTPAATDPSSEDQEEPESTDPAPDTQEESNQESNQDSPPEDNPKSESMTCDQCGAQCAHDDAFCRKCGNRVGAAS